MIARLNHHEFFYCLYLSYLSNFLFFYDLVQDYADTEMLLSRANVDQKALLSYATEAADFSTNHQLPKLDFAINHYGQPDVAMFDFTCMYASENAALVRQRNGHKLLVALVGDSLLEVSGKPIWRREIRLFMKGSLLFILLL